MLTLSENDALCADENLRVYEVLHLLRQSLVYPCFRQSFLEIAPVGFNKCLFLPLCEINEKKSAKKCIPG